MAGSNGDGIGARAGGQVIRYRTFYTKALQNGGFGFGSRYDGFNHGRPGQAGSCQTNDVYRPGIGLRAAD